MYCEHFIKDMSRLGNEIDSFLNDLSLTNFLKEAINRSFQLNPLFTVEMQRHSLHAISDMFLNCSKLKEWLQPLVESSIERENIAGIVMAGNIPLVGFHDFLCGLAAGYRLEIKLSGKDSQLLPSLFDALCNINPYWKKRVKFVEEISKAANVLIATGSDDAINKIGGYYDNIPRLLRGTRSGLALLDGTENQHQLDLLADDIFLYYGMGCRNVSSLLVPENYSFTSLINSAGRYSVFADNMDFYSAYRYNKAIFKMRNVHFIDGGFFLLNEGAVFPPPLSVVNIVYYSSPEYLDFFIEKNSDYIQVKLCKEEKSGFIPFGRGQFPSLTDYADNINTLDFLLNNCYIRIKN